MAAYTLPCGPFAWVEDRFVVVDPEQTTLTLSKRPTSPTNVWFYLNGVLYRENDAFSLDGRQLTWNTNLFTLDVGDEIMVRFQ